MLQLSLLIVVKNLWFSLALSLYINSTDFDSLSVNFCHGRLLAIPRKINPMKVPAIRYHHCLLSPSPTANPDFNNTVIRVTFDPDEDDEDNEQEALIAITNDDIDEAMEQVFIAYLILVESNNPSSVDLSVRASSLCRIIDDDRECSIDISM